MVIRALSGVCPTLRDFVTDWHSEPQARFVSLSVIDLPHFSLSASMPPQSPRTLGFSITGQCPVRVTALIEHGVASGAGFCLGDQIISINDENVISVSHDYVCNLLRKSHAGVPVKLLLLQPSLAPKLIPRPPAEILETNCDEFGFMAKEHHDNENLTRPPLLRSVSYNSAVLYPPQHR